MEVNQKEIQATVEHYEGAPHAEAMHLFTALQDQASMFYPETLKKRHMRKLSEHLRTDLGTSIWLQGTAIK
jgi:hypothetical protein